jgi:hypothetical protein
VKRESIDIQTPIKSQKQRDQEGMNVTYGILSPATIMERVEKRSKGSPQSTSP